MCICGSAEKPGTHVISGFSSCCLRVSNFQFFPADRSLVLCSYRVFVGGSGNKFWLVTRFLNYTAAPTTDYLMLSGTRLQSNLLNCPANNDDKIDPQVSSGWLRPGERAVRDRLDQVSCDAQGGRVFRDSCMKYRELIAIVALVITVSARGIYKAARWTSFYVFWWTHSHHSQLWYVHELNEISSGLKVRTLERRVIWVARTRFD